MAHERRIVGVDRDRHASQTQRVERMAGAIGIPAELDVGTGADVQRYASIGELRHEVRVFDRPDPVVDAFRQEELQGVAHAFWTAGFAGVDRAVQAGLRRPTKRVRKTRAGPSSRRFVAVDGQCDDARMTALHQPLDELERLGRGLLPQQADAQPDARQTVSLGLRKPRIECVDECVQSLAPG